MPQRLYSSILTGQVQNDSVVAGDSIGVKERQYGHTAQCSVHFVMMSWVPTVRRTPQMSGDSSDRHLKFLSHLVANFSISSLTSQAMIDSSGLVKLSANTGHNSVNSRADQVYISQRFRCSKRLGAVIITFPLCGSCTICGHSGGKMHVAVRRRFHPT